MLLVIGAGGLAKQALVDLRNRTQTSAEELVFFDNTENAPTEFFGHRVLKNMNDVKKGFSFVIGIANPTLRESFYSECIKMGGDPITLISENAIVFDEVRSQLPKGNLILPFVILEPDCLIGKGCIINTAATIHHDVKIGDFSEIMPGARILGGAEVGANCRIGSGAILLPGIKVGNNAIIAAGSIVTKNVAPNTMVAGNPAEFKKELIV